jgi:hypothetical protein
MDKQPWLLGGGLVFLLAALTMFFGFMTNPPFVRASRVRDLREMLEEARKRIEELEKHVKRCDRQLLDMRDENRWLTSRMQRLETHLADRGNPI